MKIKLVLVMLGASLSVSLLCHVINFHDNILNFIESIAGLVGISTLIFYIIQEYNHQQQLLFNIKIDNLKRALDATEKILFYDNCCQIEYPERIVPYIVQYTSDNLPNKDEVLPSTFPINKNLTIYDNFYEYIKSVKTFLPETELSLRQIICLYNNFIGSLAQLDKLEHAFQVLYTCVNSTLNNKCFKKKQFKDLEIIRDSLTSKQALLYLFNQTQYADRQRLNNEYLSKLKECSFFEKLFRSSTYIDIQTLIPLEVEKLFYK